MLARLDEQLTPFRSSVNPEGNVLRVQGPPSGSDLAQHVVAVVQEMGYVAELMAQPVIVARWFGAEEIDELTQEEARVLAERWANQLEDEELTTATRVGEPLRLMLLDAFRDAARRGTVENLRIDETCIRTALEDVEASRVLRWINQRITSPGAAGHGPD